ncbi:MAG: ATP-dependent DNA helicase [Gemmatales bacterium]|nr:MAG: ATP-dependent DNA helicase [Gemmatales bacterium]
MMAPMLPLFHPITQKWFAERFAEPTEPQRLGWPAIAERRDTLIAAPTGSGKTLTAFLYSLDRLLRLAMNGRLADRTYVVYISPLRALSNDIQRNLETPLAELLASAREQRPACQEIRAYVRTGDTSSLDRQRMVRKPPHILVTTPESLYLLLTGERSREMLRNVETVIVDEIHALARDKRGSHLALSLERLDFLCTQRPTNPLFDRDGSERIRPVRIGLSATQKPIGEIARFLVGVHADADPPVIIDTGHTRQIDLAIETPDKPLEAVCSHEHWSEIYERLVRFIREHRSTLVFVNTRRLAERVAQQLTERLGAGAVSSHHGSLSQRLRHDTEQRLKAGSLKAVVATASLELGIDIGQIDLVCQLGSPRSIATLLQRIGRAGHSLGVVPKGRLFALTRDELIECVALVRAVYEGRLDRVVIPEAPADILAQQIVAAVASDEWDEDSLFELCRRAYPYRNLERQEFDDVVTMLSEGIAPRLGRRGAYLHRDRVGNRLKARRNARLTAITCGGAIPEVADFRVITDDPEPVVVGSVHEDFALESMAGDIFLLGNTSWRIRYVRGGDVVVQDARGAPPTVPFWLGEAPGRTDELSAEVSRLREEIAGRLDDAEGATNWVSQIGRVRHEAARQVVDYAAAQYAATSMLPTQKRILFERFFDESGGMQLVIHAPFGTRINRAWGLALRKRFCRSFNFELQASASDNGIILSLGPQHSFPLEQMFSLVNSKIAREILIQALLAVPFFTTRWRWNSTRALAVRRFEGGRRVPPALQRFRADDLLSAVFPMQTACLENIVGDIEVPDHPLVRQTMEDCLTEATDVDGWIRLLQQIEQGEIELVGMDTREPSPFSHELLNANPYAFLDDAPLEERRARAITLRRSLSPEAVRDLGRLEPEAISQVRQQAWPIVRDADELHDTLLSLVVVTPEEGREWRNCFRALVTAGRAAEIEVHLVPANALPTSGSPASNEIKAKRFWVAAERWPIVRAVWPDVTCDPPIQVPDSLQQEWLREDALAELLRGRMEVAGPIAESHLADFFGLSRADVQTALLRLEGQGSVLRGQFTHGSAAVSSKQNGAGETEWCDRRLLARIHRLTLDGLRRQIEPVSPERYVGFLCQHQHVKHGSRLRGETGLLTVIEQLQGFEAPAGDWERFLLPHRLVAYNPAWLDLLTLSGQVLWGRVKPVIRPEGRSRPIKPFTRSIPMTLMLRRDLPWLLGESEPTLIDRAVHALGGNARMVYETLRQQGALFVSQLLNLLPVAPGQLRDALGELAAAGLVTCDGFAGLRWLLGGTAKKADRRRRLTRSASQTGIEGGRWSLLHSALPSFASAPLSPRDQNDIQKQQASAIENWCRLLIRRYGVVFRDLLQREPAAPSWQALLRTFRTLEARGEIRGGRFVAGVAGEQFALTQSIHHLRHDKEEDAVPLVLTATDPINLSGRVLAGLRVPAARGNRIVMRNGQLVACRIGKEIRLAESDREPDGFAVGKNHEMLRLLNGP